MFIAIIAQEIYLAVAVTNHMIGIIKNIFDISAINRRDCTSIIHNIFRARFLPGNVNTGIKINHRLKINSLYSLHFDLKCVPMHSMSDY